ncbi:MAG: efflux RND transporter periplasmic adaptor subunit [Bacteroidetes bacterium]|nr:efflux RND transporter periplasmic adaptor subunit [Bacteroidota bacterium]
MNKYFKYSLIALALLIAAFAAVRLLGNGNSAAVQLRTATVEPATLVSSVTATGTVNPVDQVDVGTQVSGLVYKIFVDYNSPVTKGQLLAELDKTTLSQAVDIAQANYTAALNEETYYLANFTRQQQMYQAGVISKADYEQATYQRNNAAATVAQRRTSLTQAQANLGYASIHSPIDGIIISKEVEEGQTVAASMSTPTLFTIAKDLGKMQVEAAVDEADIGGVAEGQRVSFTVDAFPQEQFSGKVRQVRLGATTTSNVVTYSVIIDADNPDKKLKPGLTATVTIYTLEKPQVLTVSPQALAFAPEATLLGQYYKEKAIKGEVPAPAANGGKLAHVWLLNSDGSLAEKQVDTGTSNGVQVEITAGLEAGSQVVLGMEVATATAGTGQAGSNNSSPFMPTPPKRQSKKSNAQ